MTTCCATFQNKQKHSFEEHGLFSILQKIVRQHLGLEDIVEAVIERIGNVDQIALTGNYAMGIDSGTIEIIINGSKVNKDYL